MAPSSKSWNIRPREKGCRGPCLEEVVRKTNNTERFRRLSCGYFIVFKEGECWETWKTATGDKQQYLKTVFNCGSQVCSERSESRRAESSCSYHLVTCTNMTSSRVHNKKIIQLQQETNALLFLYHGIQNLVGKEMFIHTSVENVE